MDASVSPFLLYGAAALGALGVSLALPRKGVSPQLVGALLAAVGLGGIFLALALGLGGPNGAWLPNINFYVFSIIALGGALRVISHPRPVYAALYFILTILSSAGLYVLLAAEFMAFALIIVYAGAILITYLFVIMLATETPVAEEVEALAEYDRESREPVAATAVGFVLVAALTALMVSGTSGLTPPETYFSGQRIEEMPRKVASALADAGLMDAKTDRIARASADGPPLIDLTPDETGRLHGSVTIEYGQGQRQVITTDNPKWPADLTLSNVEGVGFSLLADHPGAIEIAGIILLMAMLGAVVLARKKVDLDEAEKLAAAGRHLPSPASPEATAP